MKYKIIYDRKNCIGSFSCVVVAPKFWEVNEDCKADLKEGILNPETGFYERIFETEDYDSVLESAEVCPVTVIRIERIEDNGKVTIIYPKVDKTEKNKPNQTEGNEKKYYIIFQPPDNEEIQLAVKSWLAESGGSLSLDEIENRFNATFHFFYPQIYTEEEMSNNSPIRSWKKFTFKLKNGIVYRE